MGDKRVIRTAVRPGRWHGIAVVAAVWLAMAAACWPRRHRRSRSPTASRACSAASRRRPTQSAPPAASEGQSELTCPPVSIRAGASTYAVAAPGKQPVGNDLRYQATITRTARDCTLNGGQITARIGIQGRVIAGPAGAPATVEIPLRVAVVQGGVQEKTIATKVYRTTVSMTEAGSVPFSLVAEDLVYPVPPGAAGDSYIFYIGFDPQALKPEPKPKAAKKKK